MTKLTTLTLGLCLILFIGCNKDEENFLTPLVGTWQTFVITSTGCTDPADNGTLTCTGAPCFEVSINSNGTYILQDNTDLPAYTETGTVTVTASSITLCETGATDCSPETYTLSGDTLVIIFTDDDSPGCTFTATFSKK